MTLIRILLRDNIHDFVNARSHLSWRRLLRENLHVIRNTDEKPTVKKLFDMTQRLIQVRKTGNLRSVRNKFDDFSMEKAVPGERRRDNQSLEGKSLRNLRLCVVSWESPSVPSIKR